MKTKISLHFLCLFLITFTGCAPVQFYSDAGMTHKTGLKFYNAKPYLQVERDNVSGKIVKSAVLYLPDLANPQYMAVKNGPGSSKVDLKLNDEGTMSTFGFTSDAGIEKYIESLSTLISKGSAAIEDLNSLKGPESLKAGATQTELYEITSVY